MIETALQGVQPATVREDLSTRNGSGELGTAQTEEQKDSP